MTTLKCLQEHQRDSLTPPKIPKKRKIQKEGDLIDLFPLPRYFQVHFEYIHDNNHEVQNKLNRLNQTMAKVEDKLDRVISLLNPPVEPEY